MSKDSVKALRARRKAAGLNSRGAPKRPPVSEVERKAKAVKRQQRYRARQAEAARSAAAQQAPQEP
jgi:hypothetical protein